MKIGAKWVSGNLVFYDRGTGDDLLTLSPDGVDIEAGVTETVEIDGTTFTITNGIITGVDEGNEGD